jgi:hypothetical protein
MNSTNIHGSDNKVAGRDIHIHYGQSISTKNHDFDIDEKQLLTLEVQSLESAIKTERSSILKSWPFISMVISTLTFFPLCFFFLFEIFEYISITSKWTSIDKAEQYKYMIHHLWIVPFVVIEIAATTWFSKSSESAFNTISILKNELAKQKAQLQIINSRN